jgi:hypothetical protein
MTEKEEYGEDRGEDDDEAAVDDWAGMEKRIKNLEDAVADLKEKLESEDDTEEEVEEEVEMKEEPSTNPKTIKTTEVVEFSSEEVEDLKAENVKLKAELDKSPAEAPLNTNKFSAEKTVLSKVEYNKLTKRERFLYNLNK